ncbi:MAG: DMT family transporter [Paracoccaceae bacterium]|nr:DMT family transporter [Paracoccaceae bacterium]
MTALPRDRILAGIALMMGFNVLAPLLDVSAKLAAETIPVGQITAARFVVQGALMLPVVLIMRLSWHASSRMVALVVLRAALLIAATYSYVAAIAVMPIADALAIVFVEPFLVLILGWLLFKDEIGLRRIAASVVGFGGVMLVIQPSLAVYGLVTLYPLATALSFTLYMLVTRAMSGGMHPVVMQLHTSLAGMAICLPLIWLADDSGWTVLDPVMPQGRAWLWLFGVGFWAGVSHMCMTYALKFAPASTLAPLHYLEIVTAVALGYLIFGDFPNAPTWAGIGIIVASGLYVVHRERLIARAQTAAAALTTGV